MTYWMEEIFQIMVTESNSYAEQFMIETQHIFSIYLQDRLPVLVMFNNNAKVLLCTVLTSFIHSGYFYSASSSPQLLRGTSDCSSDTV